MNKENIGWKFPPTSGGSGDGFNDSGIAHFKGSPMSSLARETIQNSLDARKSHIEPVHVDFELIELGRDVQFGREHLARAIASCLRSRDCDRRASSELKAAQKAIKAANIPCLRVSDRNTTGLLDDQWRALVKTRGLSIKPGEGAGGSHGIGKAAPFAVSTLRTVFYWTHYRQDGESFESFQGKSVLMSHDNEGEETQGTGFYGLKDGCRELSAEAIPRRFRLLSPEGEPVLGTSVYILGFRASTDWRRRVAESVIESYFYAIATHKLTVIVEHDDQLTRHGLVEMDADSLEKWFDFLDDDRDVDDRSEEGVSSLNEARVFWKIACHGEQPVEKQDVDFGHIRLWINVADGLPNRVGFVRATGMLVTAQQRGLIRFPGFQDFAALCVFEDPRGNELLREMENPQHDQFEPSRLPDDQQARGRRALNRITRWIRDEVRKLAGPPEGDGPTVLSELSAYLPDWQPDEQFEDDRGEESPETNKEPGFGERVTIRLKPLRLPVFSVPDNDATEDRDGEGEDTGSTGGGATEDNNGQGGNGSGSGEGEGHGGAGGRGGTTSMRSIPVSSVRLLPIAGKDNLYRLSFRAEAQGVVRLELQEAGDSSPIPRSDVRIFADEGAEASLGSVALATDGRTELVITADGPIGGRSWRLSATEVDKP